MASALPHRNSSFETPSLPLQSRHSLGEVWGGLCEFEELPPVDKWLQSYFRRNRKFGKRDRTLVRNQIFLALRHLEALTHHSLEMENLNREEEPAWIPQTIWERARTLSWAELCATSNSLAELPLHQQGRSVPRFFDDHLLLRQQRSEWSRQEALAFARSQNKPAPLWIRLNTVHLGAKETAAQLQESGVNILEQLDDRLRVQANTSLYHTPSFAAGAFEIQDWSSQEIGAHCWSSLTHSRENCPHSSFKVWDCCAGAGGKTLQLATLLRNKGAIYSTDIRQRPLQELKKRAKRDGLTNIRTMVWDATEKLSLPRSVACRGGYDLVLIDAPCSSSGTWRRNPEARYRFKSQTLSDFKSLQANLLRTASAAVAPGGVLTYSTCSWFVEENEQQIDDFLNWANGEYSLISQNLHQEPNGNSDTMFSACLRKNT